MAIPAPKSAPAIVAPAPVSAVGLFSNPRAPTTTWPLRAIRSVSGRHNRLYGRVTDRGGFRPALGNQQQLPDGDMGGVQRGIYYRGQLAPAVKRSNVEPVTATASAFSSFARRRLWALRGAPDAARLIRVVPGKAALQIARSRRFVPGTPSGFQGGLRDLARFGKMQRGFFYGESRTPRSVWERLVGDRMDGLRFGRTAPPATIDPGTSSPADGLAASTLARSGMAGAGMLDTELVDTPSNGGGNGVGGNLLGIGAVLAVAWFLFR